MKIKYRTKKQKRTILILGLILVLLIGVLGGMLLSLYLSNNRDIFSTHLIGIKTISDCSNLSLDETSYCLRQNLSSFFKYNMSNKHKTLNQTELEQEGGVCWQWTDWYEKNIKSLTTYNTQHVIVKNMGNSSHEFLIAYDNETYCILDQLNIGCV